MFKSTFNARDRKHQICNRIRSRIDNIPRRPIDAQFQMVEPLDIQEVQDGIFRVDKDLGIQEGSAEAIQIESQLVARQLFNCNDFTTEGYSAFLKLG